MKILTILILSNVIWLAGCPATAPTLKPEIVIQKVPVPVPCKITPPEKPVMPVDDLKKEAPLFDKVQAGLAELERREAYEKKLEAAIKECQ